MASLGSIFTGVQGADVPAPPPSPQYQPSGIELDIQARQAELLNKNLALQDQQQQQYQQIRTALEQAYGMPLSQIIAQSASGQAQTNQLLQQRYIDALKGDLPVDPALERQLKTEQQVTENTLRQRLGPGFETSTAGSQVLADERQRAQELRYQASHDAITDAQRYGPLGMQSLLSTFNTPYFNQRFLQSPPQLASLLGQEQFVGGLNFRGALAGFGAETAAGRLQAELDMQQNLANAQLGGQILGAGATIGAAALSSALFKKDIVPLDRDEWDFALARLVTPRERDILEERLRREDLLRTRPRQMAELPDPADYRGEVIRDRWTGERLRSDGTQWVATERKALERVLAARELAGLEV